MLLKLSEDESIRYAELMEQKARWSKMAREDYVRAEGEARGEAKGLTKGKAEERTAIARNLKTAGLPLDIIARSTGLSLKEVDAL
jgi:predicted transposase/invertase (TIGR01784 family)